MEVMCTATTSDKLSSRAIIDGQIIALFDRDEAYYDLNKERHVVSGKLHVDSLSDVPSTKKQPNMLYIVKDKGIYVYDNSEDVEDFKLLASVNTDENVKTSPSAKSSKVYLVGTTTDTQSVGQLEFDTDVFLDTVTGKITAKGFNGKATSASSADSATKATNDSKDQQIDATYIKDVAITGRVVTLTKGDGSVSTQETQDNDTHYVTGLVVAGSKDSKTNAAAANGLVHLILLDDDNIRAAHLIKGEGATSVTCDVSGNIIIKSTDTNTTYENATQTTAGLQSAEDKKKLDGIAAGANKYELPISSTSLLGGIIIGDNLTMESNGKLSIVKDNIIDALGYTPVDEDELDVGVTGVRGSKEANYRKGQVSLSCENIGALPDDTHYAKSNSVGGDALKAQEADKASKAFAVIDKSSSDESSIYLAYSGENANASDALSIGVYTINAETNEIVMKPMHKAQLRTWLGLGSMAYEDAGDYQTSQSTAFGMLMTKTTDSSGNILFEFDEGSTEYPEISITETYDGENIVVLFDNSDESDVHASITSEKDVEGNNVVTIKKSSTAAVNSDIDYGDIDAV